jgi:hypothetical protein
MKIKQVPDNLIFCDGSTKDEYEYYSFVVLTKDGYWYERSNKRKRKEGPQLHELLAVQKAHEFHKKYLEGFTVIYTDVSIIPSAVNGNNKYMKNKYIKIINKLKDKSILIRYVYRSPSILPYKYADLLCRRKKRVCLKHKGFPAYFNKNWINCIRWRSFESYFNHFKNCNG